MSNDCRCLWSFPCLKKQELPRRRLLGDLSAATLLVWNSRRRSCSRRRLMKQQLLRRQQATIRHTHACFVLPSIFIHLVASCAWCANYYSA